MCCSADIPKAPVQQEVPPPADMSGMYQVQADNMATQNMISQNQLNLAKRQAGIAESEYGRWNDEIKPVEQQAIKSAKRGIDPLFYEGLSRNATVQQATPLLQGTGKTMSGAGIKSDSPRAMASVRGLETGLAMEMAGGQLSARDQAEKQNTSQKGAVINLGRGIPGTAVSGYGSASGVMANAGGIMDRAAKTAADVYQGIAQQQNAYAMNEWTNQNNETMNQYQNDVARAQAQAQANSQAISAGIAIVGTIATIAVAA